MHWLVKIAAPLALLAGWSAPAAAAWREASSDHFVIYSEESADSLRRFAERLERYDRALRYIRKLPNEPVGAANRLTIYVVSSLDTVRKLAGGGAAARSVAGFYLPRASGSIAIVPRRGLGGSQWDLDAQTVLLHEYAHHFLFNTYSAAYPAWFSEGFAEFNSTASFEDDGSVGLGLPAAHRYRGLFSGNPLPVPRMIAHGTGRLDDLEREALYGRGWLLTHYLSFEKSRAGQLDTFLRSLNDGKKGPEAAAAAFGDLKVLDRELSAYMKRSKLSYLKIGGTALQIGAINVRQLSAAEDAVMDVKIRSRRGVNLEAARQLLPRVRSAAAPFSKDPFVQATLAEAEYDARTLDEALAAADRALASNPKHIDALIYKGRALMEKARKAQATDDKTWKEVRRWLVAANRADPDDPEPLLLFYESFQAAGARPTPNAVIGLNRAFELAPQDRGVRMTVARQYLVDGKTAEARSALAPIAFDPHAGELATLASLMVTVIDSGGAAAALKALEANAKPEAADKPAS